MWLKPTRFKPSRLVLLTVGAGPLLLGPLPDSTGEPVEAAWVDEGIEEVYLSAEEALKIVLPETDEILTQEFTLTEAQRARIEAYAGRPMARNRVTIYLGRLGGKPQGYALVTEEIGMYKPMTSMVGITPEGTVREVVVMVYRESRGGQVRRKRFLSQYRHKRTEHPIRINRDIINVTGATLSVRSMNAQVRKALAIVQELFLSHG